jgi:hypothetical protein
MSFALKTYLNFGNQKLPITLRNTTKPINSEKVITAEVYLSWVMNFSLTI